MMPSFSPELISTMRAALDDAMTHIPVDQATSGIKIRLAEIILLPRGRPVMSCCTRRRSAKFRRCSHCSHRCKNLIGAGSTRRSEHQVEIAITTDARHPAQRCRDAIGSTGRARCLAGSALLCHTGDQCVA